MPKKKPGRNGYWQFVLETRDKMGGKRMSKEELESYTGKKWANMSKEERKPFEERAQLARRAFDGTKYTSDGLDIAVVEKQAKEAVDKQQEMRKDISRIIKLADCNQRLDQHIFFIIHINYLTHYPAEDKFYICEIAVSAVCLRNGVVDVFHRLVKPGKLPLGFYGSAKTHSKLTHQLLEFCHEEPYEDNTEEVFTEMVSFMKGHTKEDILTVYTKEIILDMTENVIQNFRAEFSMDEKINVYSLEVMFGTLKNTVAGNLVWPTDSTSQNEVEKDVYSYTADIACQFHEDFDISVFCSKSIVTRYGYMICDHCCPDLNIQLVAGVHVPVGVKVPQNSSGVVTNTPWSYSNESGQQVQEVRGQSSTGYEQHFPRLGGSSHVSTPSVVSFSSMKSARNETQPAPGPRAAARLEQSFRAIQVNEARRDHRNLHFPEHGCDKHAKLAK
jgi:protein maelstrom